MAKDLSSDLASLRIDRSAPPRSRSWAKVLLGVMLAGGVVAAGIAATPHLEARIFKTSVEATEIASFSPAQASVELTATGYVEADRASRIAPKVPGRVALVHVEQGQLVEAGEVLLELDPTDDRASIRAAQSETAAATARAKSARARAAVAQAQLAEIQQQSKRERALADQGVVTEASAEDLEARVESLQQTVSASQAEAEAAAAEAAALGAQVGVLQTGMKNLTLTAPIAGTVINRPPQIGEYMGPQPPGVAVDMGSIRIADFSTLIVETDIPEGRLSQIRPGAPTEIVLDAYPDRRFRGEVQEITPEVDRAKATVVVKVKFLDELEGVLPDMSARVSFLSKALDEGALKAPPKTVLPGTAIADRAGSKVVFVIDGNSVRMVPVQLGAPFGNGFELVSGPSPGTKVVANPPATLADGQSVKLATPDDSQ